MSRAKRRRLRFIFSVDRPESPADRSVCGAFRRSLFGMNWKKLCVGSVLFAAAVFSLFFYGGNIRAGESDASAAPPEVVVFSRGENFFYRIPTIMVTNSGTVIAAANARWNSSHDFSPTTLVVRRREFGKNWEPPVTIGGDEKKSCGIGSSVYDPLNDRIFIFGGSGVFISDDDGKTFRSEPLPLTPHARTGKKPGTHGAAPGIVLRHGEHAGRILVPARFALRPETAQLQRNAEEFREFLTKENYNCAIFSDDRGKTWSSSSEVQLGTGEGTLAELGDGTVYYNSRAYFNDHRRRIAVSRDGGETFGEFGEAADLREPPLGCNAGLLRVEPKTGAPFMLYSGPQHLTKRTDLTLMFSEDDGKSWKPLINLTPGCFGGYSALAWSEKEQKACMVYETDKHHPGKSYGDIVFVEFELNWIRNHSR